MIVHVSAEAEHDLEAIGDFSACGSPARALSFVQELRAKCLGLGDMPERFPLLPCYEAAGLRRRAHGNYLIFYCVEADEVVVIHVLNSAQDYASILSIR